MIEVTLDDMVTPLLRQMNDGMGTMMQELVQQESDAILPFVRQNTPIGTHYNFDGSFTRGGQLKDSLHFVVGQFGAYLSGAQQGVFVAAGTDPHEIRPRSAKALAFFWPKVGSGVLFGHVNHPGTQPNDFRQIGLQEAFDTETVHDVAKRVLAEWVMI